MQSDRSGRLVVLSGPSCVGKSPLANAIAKFFPNLASRLRPLVLYNSRSPRPGELDGIDYYFRTREQVDAFRSDQRYIVLDVRGDLQALDLGELSSLLNSGDVIFEGNPFVGLTLLTHPVLANIPKLSVFLSPLSKAEILGLQSPECNLDLKEFVSDVMRRKLLRRTRRQKGELSAKDLENIEKRAGSAYAELQTAWHFDHVIPNHDGEDSDNWDAFCYPLGDARNALIQFAALIEGKVPMGLEKWDAELLPSGK